MRGLLSIGLLASLALAGPAAAKGYLDDLSIAAVRGDAETVRAMLADGADPNAEGWLGLTALSAAVRSCRTTPQVLRALIEAGADLEARSGLDATPLMVAFQRGRADLAAVLIDAGADTQAVNAVGDSVADYAGYFAGLVPDAEFRALRYSSLGFEPGSDVAWQAHCADPSR